MSCNVYLGSTHDKLCICLLPHIYPSSHNTMPFCFHYYAPPVGHGALSDDARLTSVCLSVAYIGPKSRTERSRKTEIGTVLAHVTCDLDTTFKVKGQLAWAYCGGLPHSLFAYVISLPCNIQLLKQLLYTFSIQTLNYHWCHWIISSAYSSHWKYLSNVHFSYCHRENFSKPNSDILS